MSTARDCKARCYSRYHHEYHLPFTCPLCLRLYPSRSGEFVSYVMPSYDNNGRLKGYNYVICRGDKLVYCSKRSCESADGARDAVERRLKVLADHDGEEQQYTADRAKSVLGSASSRVNRRLVRQYLLKLRGE